MPLNNKEIFELREELKKNLAIQQEITGNADAYLKLIEKIKNLQKEANALNDVKVKQSTLEREALRKLEAAKKKAQASATVANKAAEDAAQRIYDIESKRLEIILELQNQNAKLIKQYAEQARAANEFRAVIKGTFNDIKGVAGALRKAYNFFEVRDVLKMSKSIKSSALQMGVLSKQADSFSSGIQAAALQTIDFGVGIEDIAKIQSTYSDDLGTTVMLSQQGAEALGQMAIATGLGSEGAGTLAANMSMIGYSAEKTGEFIEQVMNDAHKMGINSSKVIKSISSNIKLLNRFNFKDGAKGLAKMVAMTNKLGLSVEAVAPMAEKLFDIEGAVDMSAQLQVLGGEWSKLADPFKLMYMARNDMEALTKSIIDATKGTAKFNTETKEFDISALEMQRLRKIAEATGLNFEELADSAKRAAKFSVIKGQIDFDIDKDTKEFIESNAALDENKKATIKIGLDKKYLNNLSDTDKKLLKAQAHEAASMKQRALDSVTFDEKISNTITMLKQLLVPLVESFNNVLAPKVDELIKRFRNPEIIKALISVSKTIGNFVGGIGKFIIEFPAVSLGILGLLEATKWYANGLTLAKGFNAGASVGGKPNSGFLGTGKGGTLGKVAGGGLGGAAVGITNAIFADSVKEGVGNVAGGVIGGALGSLIGPMGTIFGAQIGASLGGMLGKYFNDKDSVQTQQPNVGDGIIKFNPRDKFMQVNNDTMVAGTNVNGNKELAKTLSGSIPGLQNSSGLRKQSEKGTFNQAISNAQPQKMKIEFGEITFGGSIELTAGQGNSADLGKILLKSPSFLRDISKMVHINTEAAVSGKHS